LNDEDIDAGQLENCLLCGKGRRTGNRTGFNKKSKFRGSTFADVSDTAGGV
jgi:hypothetical protein